jgi:hypothetical protein
MNTVGGIWNSREDKAQLDSEILSVLLSKGPCDRQSIKHWLVHLRGWDGFFAPGVNDIELSLARLRRRKLVQWVVRGHGWYRKRYYWLTDADL